jgi:LuxR family maltose regulon positive regulatory protein
VSAPAGFGKTTAVVDWLDGAVTDGKALAWLSLDKRDNDAVLFWEYVVAALHTIREHLAPNAMALLRAPEPAVSAIVPALINDLSAGPEDVVLVLDDYHFIDSQEIHDSVAFLVEHLPAQLRLVITSRVDPPLPLARLRAAGQLLEIRAADLRFTLDEAGSYLHHELGDSLTAQDVATLAGRTEGWIAALQLASLSMRGRDDLSSFVAGFAGDDRYVVDYLVEEVLDRIPPEINRFLLETSILYRLSGPLCDAVTGRDGSKATLERLERSNMFLVPLDPRRQWYRYHHLFRDVLHAHLLDEHASALPELHARASAWLASNGDLTDAIRHALEAGDPELAADVTETAIPTWRRGRQESVLRNWLERIPDQVIRRRPVLMVARIGALAAIGQFDSDAEATLDEAERLLRLRTEGGPRGAEVVVADEDQLPALPTAIEMYRAALALTRGDLDATDEHGRRALDIAPDDNHLERAGAAALVGLASWTRGDIGGAVDGYSRSVAGLKRAGHFADVLGCSITLADLALAQGRLRDAFGVYADALELSTSQSGPPLRGTADMHVGLSEIHRERNELVAAREHLQKSREIGEHNGLPQNPYRWRLAMARLLEADGDLAAAVELLDESERVYSTDFSPSVRPVPAVRAGLLATHGRVGDAMAWVRESGVAADDDLDYLCEFEHLTLARVLLARFRAERSDAFLDDAVGLLERLLEAADAGGRAGASMQILVLLALARDAGGDRVEALAQLERALQLGEPQGYVRVFLDEGPPLRALLDAVDKRSPSAGYAKRLSAPPKDPAPRAATPLPLVDRLSDREIDVLRLLGTDLSGPEIARELTVSLNTVRTHTKNIYAKLGVSSRRAAVRQADTLQLLSHRNRR